MKKLAYFLGGGPADGGKSDGLLFNFEGHVPKHTRFFLCFGAERLAAGIQRYTPGPYQDRQNPYSRSCLRKNKNKVAQPPVSPARDERDIDFVS